jgi:hypothetical protein
MPDLSFRIQKQEELNWCWAAVSASVAQYYEDSKWQRQCSVVNAALAAIRGVSDCCTDGATLPCNIPWDLRKALLAIGHLDSLTNGPLSFAGIAAQVQNKRPLACRILSPGPAAHFVAVIGCAETPSGEQWVTIADPSRTTGDTVTALYRDLTSNYLPNSRWDLTYLTK